MEAVPRSLASGGDHAADGLSVVSDVETAVTEIAVHGRWSRRLCLDVYGALRECMAEHPSAVIIDLRDLNDLDAASTTMWLAASRAASALQPPAQLVLSMPPTRQLASHLRRLGAVRFLPIYATMKHARDAVATRLPSINRLQLSQLRPEAGAAGVAADAVAIACAAWGLPELVDSGRQIMTELMTNAVEHADTDMALAISLRGTGLHLAVHDGDQRLACPRIAAPPASAQVGQGLRILNSRASAWGTVPTRNGKVVWAIVRPRRRGPQ